MSIGRFRWNADPVKNIANTPSTFCSVLPCASRFARFSLNHRRTATQITSVNRNHFNFVETVVAIVTRWALSVRISTISIIRLLYVCKWWLLSIEKVTLIEFYNGNFNIEVSFLMIQFSSLSKWEKTHRQNRFPLTQNWKNFDPGKESNAGNKKFFCFRILLKKIYTLRTTEFNEKYSQIECRTS